jgi:hypothetical protein
MVANVLLATGHILLERDDDAWVITMTRTSAELPRDRPGLEAFYDRVVAALDSIDRSRYALVVDGRAAVGRNDEVFEAVQAAFSARLFGGFRQLVAVVSTTVGRMQVARYDAERAPTPLFTTVEEAHAYVARTA